MLYLDGETSIKNVKCKLVGGQKERCSAAQGCILQAFRLSVKDKINKKQHKKKEIDIENLFFFVNY